MLNERKAEHRDQKQEQRERQGRDEPIGKIADVVLALANEPACSEQRVADAQATAAKHREGAHPAPPSRSRTDRTTARLSAGQTEERQKSLAPVIQPDRL